MAKYNAEKNSLVEIVLVSWILGSFTGASLIALAGGCLKTIPTYILILVVYFMVEFISSASSQPSRVHLRSFLIYGNPGSIHFWGMQCFMWMDLWFGLLRVPNYMKNFGLVLTLAGLLTRAMAMRTCGESFAHIIDTEKTAQLSLATDGIYRWSRHPSYLGFWCFAVGTLFVLGGCLSIIVTVAVLTVFFKRRIRFEEHFLVKIYGEEYLKYRRTVGTMIPGV